MPAPHISHPFRVSGGSIAVVDQGSIEEIEDCVEACVNTIVGTRLDAPDYGVPDEAFKQLSPNPSVAAYLAAVDEAEPRASVLGKARVEGMIEKVILESRARR